MKKTWVEDALDTMSLSQEAEGYLYGRGAKESVIKDLHCVSWQPTSTWATDKQWLRQFGPSGKGEWIADWLVIPLKGPRGQVLGFESRPLHKKQFNRWLMPQAYWNPVFCGLTEQAMSNIWDGGDVWLVEGIFDAFALQWAVPSKDAVLGTVTASLNARQLEFLRRFCKGWVHVVYDNDESGRKGTHGWKDQGKYRWGALKKLSSVNVKCREVTYTGADPGEVWDRGGEAGVKRAFSL